MEPGSPYAIWGAAATGRGKQVICAGIEAGSR